MSGTDDTDETSKDQQDGQVSEMVPDAPEPISSGDSVAGQPDPHPGEVDEGAQGPNAVPDDPTGEHPHNP
jgi:hypothetical protein